MTLLYQFNSAPWEPQLTVNPDGGDAVYSDPDDRPTDVIANEIMEATKESNEEGEGHPSDLSDDFLDAIEPFPITSGKREAAWETSPVGSSRFL